MTYEVLKGLQPQRIWQIFGEISKIPRATFKEEKILEYVKQFASLNNFNYTQDNAGNILIVKEKQHCNSTNIVCLQAHCDMVWNKSSSSNFNFENSPIDIILDGNIIKANNTTLGADNGIGMAVILAILESKSIVHPKLEALITVSEEIGLGGASKLDIPLQSNIMLNLDSEDDNVITIGSAGAFEIDFTKSYNTTKVSNNKIFYEIGIDNLTSGHSGVDIDKNRANAIKLLGRILYQVNDKFGCDIANITSINARNVIAIRSSATIAIDKEKNMEFNNFLHDLYDNIKKEYEVSDKSMTFLLKEVSQVENVLALEDKNILINLLQAVFNGIYKLNQSSQMVETSCNLAYFVACDNKITAKILLRSSCISSQLDMKNTMVAMFNLAGFSYDELSGYNPWQPNYDSKLTTLASNVYEELFNEKPVIEAIHAGLEVAIIDKLDVMDKISIGPNIREPHSPQEYVEINSVVKFYTYLQELLKKL
jgi:dipeptidase D